MPRNQWDYSDILMGQQAGQIWGNAYANMGQQLGGSINQYAKKQEENKLALAKGKSVEGVIKTHPELFGGQESVDRMLATDPNESPIARYSRLSDVLSNTVVAGKIKEISSAFEQDKMKADLLRSQIGAATAKAKQGGIDNAALSSAMQGGTFDLGKYMSTGGSIPGLKDMGIDIDKYMPQKPMKVYSPDEVAELAKQGIKVSGKPDAQGNIVATAIEPWAQPAPQVGSIPEGYSLQRDQAGGWSISPIPGAPKTKAQEEKEKIQAAKESISGHLGNVAQKYFELDQAGGSVKPENSLFTNIGARLSASELGQIAGSYGGTQTQQIRDTISGIKPILIANLKQATGMSAQQLNSNQELKFYLGAMGDDTKSLESNLAALYAMDSQFGSGHALDALFEKNPRLAKKIIGEASKMQADHPVDFGEQAKPTVPVPAVGETRYGYTFTAKVSNDPKDRRNWEPSK